VVVQIPVIITKLSVSVEKRKTQSETQRVLFYWYYFVCGSGQHTL
jgi:hypothetical protein